MRSIETEYKGYLFRSRLEARWAVFFDALQIRWQYETEGFQRGGEIIGDRILKYLPDFYLPDTETWVEVRGNMTIEDADKLAWMLDYGSPLPGIEDGVGSKYDLNKKKVIIHGLLLLGDIPEPISGFYLHPLIQHKKGLTRNFVEFGNRYIPEFVGTGSLGWLDYFIDPNEQNYTYEYLDAAGSSPSEKLKFFSTTPISLRTPRLYQRVRDAYRAARSARFEYGYNEAAC